MPVFIDYREFYNVDNDFTDVFYNNLRRTIAWTETIINKIDDTSKIDYTLILRSTNPVYQGEPFYKYSNFGYLFKHASTPELSFNYNEVLNNVMSLRVAKVLPEKDLANFGKILKFEIDLTTHDGAPCAESGFVDESDIPPIDTWFYITKRFLFCWIPTRFLKQMQDAIDVEIFGSYTWLEQTDNELNQRILDRLRQNTA
jgi:hypothetical protein